MRISAMYACFVHVYIHVCECTHMCRQGRTHRRTLTHTTHTHTHTRPRIPCTHAHAPRHSPQAQRTHSSSLDLTRAMVWLESSAFLRPPCGQQGNPAGSMPSTQANSVLSSGPSHCIERSDPSRRGLNACDPSRPGENACAPSRRDGSACAPFQAGRKRLRPFRDGSAGLVAVCT